jgi:class 3 adenylate cyclase/pSer/pThr/pTyr-binding forkhead associated (FHA) protein
VITDARASWHHAVLRLEDGRWVLADNGSANGTYAGDQRVDRIEIAGQCVFRLGHPADGPVLSCTVGRDGPGTSDHPHAGAAGLPGGDAAAAAGPPSPRPGQIPPAGKPTVVRPLPTQTLRIGRAEDNDIVVADPAVSRHHAELRKAAGVYHIADLGSNNGTYVNGQRITTARLSEGDVVVIGTSTFRLAGRELQEFTPASAPMTSPPMGGDAVGALEIPSALRRLVPGAGRFASFHNLNDNDTQRDRRQLAAVMLTDMVGYSRLAQRDEKLALDLAHEQDLIVRAIVTHFDGRAVKSLGDGVLAEFPSALDAVRCALRVQEAVEERNSAADGEHIWLRIGVHLGDVVHRGDDVFGDAVNIVARIEPQADYGGVCVSRQVYDQVHNKLGVRFESIGAPKLKNIETAIELYKIARTGSSPHRS